MPRSQFETQTILIREIVHLLCGCVGHTDTSNDYYHSEFFIKIIKLRQWFGNQLNEVEARL